MNFVEEFKSQLRSTSSQNFTERTLALFDYQYRTNEIYQAYCRHLGVLAADVQRIDQIPFLPIEFFKHHKIVCEKWTEEKIFMSSGTGNQIRSKVYVRDLDFYLTLSRDIFESFYGPINQYQLLALLPSYQQQGASSLIAMIDHFMGHSAAGSGYFLEEENTLLHVLQSNEKRILFGVSYALLDLSPSELICDNLMVMETGGMKGRRKEMIREELHEELIKGFQVSSIHSEYGMSELTSQAYAEKQGVFKFPSWAKCLIRDINDPLHYLPVNRTGGVNIIDLANVSTCAFIQTSDLGLNIDNQHFKLIGRFDNSDIRGCNLLV